LGIGSHERERRFHQPKQELRARGCTFELESIWNRRFQQIFKSDVSMHMFEWANRYVSVVYVAWEAFWNYVKIPAQAQA
jgi:hypothetical protein